MRKYWSKLNGVSERIDLPSGGRQIFATERPIDPSVAVTHLVDNHRVVRSGLIVHNPTPARELQFTRSDQISDHLFLFGSDTIPVTTEVRHLNECKLSTVETLQIGQAFDHRSDNLFDTFKVKSKLN